VKASWFAIRFNYLPIFIPQAERDSTNLPNRFVGSWKEVMQKQMKPIINLD
jgi:hypothetical protein